MSVRAYKITKLEWEKNETFNLWHNTTLMNIIGHLIYDQLDKDGCGICEISEDEIKEAIQTLEDLEYSEKEKKETKKILEKMLEQAKQNDGYVMYYCF